MSRLSDPRPRFIEDLYDPWCRLWLQVWDHRGTVADWLVRTRKTEVDKAIAEAAAEALDILPRVLGRIGADPPAIADLVIWWAWLWKLEQLHQGDPGPKLAQPRTIQVAGKTHLLIAPPGLYTLPSEDNTIFALDSQIGKSRQLDLRYRWQVLPSPDTLVFRQVSSLERTALQGTLRIGLAPFAAVGDMNWVCDPDNARGLKGAVPVQCCGSKDPGPHRAIIEAILRAAWEGNVHVLVLPELAVDEPLLQVCKDWLGTHNLRERRLRLVVAGSRHCRQGDGFANRCTLLGPLGDPLWEQDKHEYFAEWDPTALAAMSPDRLIAEAFEPTTRGSRIALGVSDIGRLLTPICIDYFIEGGLWGELGADLYVVPAMTRGLSRFQDRARKLGERHRAASFVCNAQTEGKQRCHSYLPVRGGGPRPSQVGDLPLFIVDAEIGV